MALATQSRKMEYDQSPKKRKWIIKSVYWVIGILVILLISFFVFANVYTNKSKAVVEGRLTLSGLDSNVIVARDGKGVPHLNAKNEHDLYIAQGYVQAQDRLFQMDLSRRQASGQLSEVIGEATIDRDKFFRTLGLRRAGADSYNAYSKEGKQILKWYAEGVNAFINQAKEKGKLPIEFTLLGYEPKKWSPVDSLTIGKYMAFDLGGHWQSQAFRYWATEKWPKEKAFELFPSYPKDAPTILQDYQSVKLDISKSFANVVIPPVYNGSNNWVVSGDKTKSGKPILADDPHLGLATPAIWYQMQLRTKGMDVSGVIFAGVPGIILGHNETIAWGVTNTGPDVQDLYIEKENPDKKGEFLHNEKWEKAKIVEEPIKVKGEKTIPYKVTITRHGPVINDFAYEPKGNNEKLAMKWTALEPTKELEAVIQMNKAKDWPQFEKALEDFQVPTQNFVFASSDGTIAYKANGRIPIRKNGDGMLPAPGWNDDYEWTGYIPYDQLPTVVNPKEGYIATANNKVVSDDYPYHISHEWAQPYRVMRIREFIESKNKLDVTDMENLQMDQKDLYAKEFVPMIMKQLKGLKKTNNEKLALKELENWDYIDDKDEAAPLIFHLWMKDMTKLLFEKQIPDDILALFEGKQQVVDELLRKSLNGEKSIWVEEQGGINKLLTTSLDRVLTELDDKYGKSPTDWKWGDYHQLYFEHPLSAAVKPLKWFFNSEDPLPIGGSQVTVQAASYPESGIVDHGASWRFVADTADLSRAYHIVGPGEAGNFRSEWYHDQINDWANGVYHETSLNPKNVDSKILTLEPSSKD